MKAMQEFWMNEDLLELLLSMLDLASLLALASGCPLALELIKRPLVWQHLLRTSWQLILKDSFDVDLVTRLLKMTRDPEPLLDFLEHICKKFSLLGLMQVGEHKGEIMLQLDDNCKLVGPRCFQLMQYMVAQMESKVMVLREVHLENLGGLVGRALASQATRQQQKVRLVRFRWGLTFNDEEGGGLEANWRREDVTNCISLLQNCSKWSVKGFYLHNLGELGWRSLAEASAKGEIKFVEVKREALVLGRPVDVRKVWMATKSYWRIIGLTDLIEREGEEEEGWAKIQEVLELADEKWEELRGIRWW